MYISLNPITILLQPSINREHSLLVCFYYLTFYFKESQLFATPTKRRHRNRTLPFTLPSPRTPTFRVHAYQTRSHDPRRCSRQTLNFTKLGLHYLDLRDSLTQIFTLLLFLSHFHPEDVRRRTKITNINLECFGLEPAQGHCHHFDKRRQSEILNHHLQTGSSVVNEAKTTSKYDTMPALRKNCVTTYHANADGNAYIRRFYSRKKFYCRFSRFLER